ncbi:hypothetical protein HYH02_002469 [Chlamydomonas schloesseri]|uniref:YchJ-like middle NTF2-like domain-containing protein n=1 Tax=Chlamydomonas schloesseri TaxID=2026947 RepID=A0A836BB98_9CHLO|nr:hypothetical protein HYH02_002469 [Chlamydomonas schloesseri]|eukprot:KAG2453143.1 hypothetical protein HYH02_002469 [Chlamydomonas schloesseri]
MHCSLRGVAGASPGTRATQAPSRSGVAGHALVPADTAARRAAPSHDDGCRAPRQAVLTAAKAKSGSSGAAASKGFGAAKAPAPGKDTCACGSKVVYRECCEPYHTGAAVPPDVEAALRARFCGFVKGRVPYLLSTFHPHYHKFKYGTEEGGAAKQLERDLETAVSRFKYSGFKVLETAPGSSPDEAFITFRYNSVAKTRNVRPTGDSFVAETNFDGSAKVSTTIERSRFLRDAASGGQWLFADYTLIDYPTWMEEAKQAELRARGEAGAAAGTSA